MSYGVPVGTRDDEGGAMTLRWVRSQRAAVVDLGDDVALVGRDRIVRRLEGDSAALARVVIAFLSRPRTTDEVIAHVEALAGPLGDRRAVIEQLLAHLAETGAIANPSVTAPRGRAANIVVAVSGAIAASHVPALIAALQRAGHTVEVALTPTAARFVACDALTAILQREVHTSLWPRAPHAPVPHIALARWADLVIVYPASATTIGRIANGDCSELVSAIATATRAPVVIVPSMNETMLEAPSVQRNLELLRADGRVIVHGVPSQEVAEAPTVRHTIAGAAPAPSEIAAMLDALLEANVLVGRDREGSASAWDAAYRRPLVPWASDTCDPDLAAALATHAPSPCRVLDVGCGLGQVARHAAGSGHRVVASDISEVALSLARSLSDQVVWLRDDICASALAGSFDVIVDRASLHSLPVARARAWATSMRRLVAKDGVVIVKCHRDGVPGVTTGWTSEALAALLPGFTLVSEQAAELPGLTDGTPIPALLLVFRT
ncbi:MAG: Bifunctional phosphopantothenoylcysteine decarboxylase/phosphopantothenate synthase [Myxococcales bacterium]|nr:Bifunctional phosphopantothenoylcysteine decarboxylase/phosphopantothenate synthase [Myxococcales bacterium]